MRQVATGRIWGLASLAAALAATAVGGGRAAQAERKAGSPLRQPAAVATGAASEAAAYAQDRSAPVQDDLFAGTEKFAKGASDVTEITMDPESLEMVNGSNAKRAHNLVLNVVRSYEYDKPGQYRMEDVEEIRKRLNTADWHCSVHTRDLKAGESTDVCNKRRADGLIEMAIITVEPRELSFIHTVRRAGNGSSLTSPDVDGFMDEIGPQVAEIGPTLTALQPTLAALQPTIGAELKGMMAQMRARRSERGGVAPSDTAAAGELDLGAMEGQLRDLQKEMERGMERGTEGAQPQPSQP